MKRTLAQLYQHARLGLSRIPLARYVDVRTVNSVTHKFSPNDQGTLYLVKVFGIIRLFNRCGDLLTAVFPLYEGYGDKVL
jgi:hypothetical protein